MVAVIEAEVAVEAGTEAVAEDGGNAWNEC